MSQLSFAAIYQLGNSSISNGLVQTLDGDYVLAGRVFGANDQSSAGAIRISSSGTILWQKVYSSAFTVFFKAIDQIRGRDLVTTGSFFYSIFSGDEYIWVVRLDPEGNIIWQNAFGSSTEQSDGQDIVATSDGGFIVAGSFLEKGTNISGTRILKFDADNNLEWDKRYDTGIAFAIRQTRDGGYILAGAHNIPDSLNSNIFILKLDAEGNKVWDKIYQEFEIYVLLDSGIAETGDGNFIVAAKSVIMKVDCCGNIIFAHQSGNLNLDTVVALRNEAFAVAGSLIVNNFDHAYVAALKEDGVTLIWDNTEISFPSGVNQIIVNHDGLIAGTGYLPLNINQSSEFLAIYDPVKIITA